jgi:hypothetical protein
VRNDFFVPNLEPLAFAQSTGGVERRLVIPFILFQAVNGRRTYEDLSQDSYVANPNYLKFRPWPTDGCGGRL